MTSRLNVFLQTNVLMTILQQCLISGTLFSDYINHYEPVYYDEQELHTQHKIVQRSPDSTLRFDFLAFGRSFKIRLKSDNSVYSPDLVVEDSHGPISFDTRGSYVGKLEDEKSSVHGIMTSSGHFEGIIRLPVDTYVIERAIHHGNGLEPRPFHSVIYNVKHVTFNSTICKCNQNNKHVLQKDEMLHNYWTNNARNHVIQKRAIVTEKTTCSLYVKADHMFYQKFSSNTDIVLEQLTRHVQAVNTIFQPIDFDKDGSPDNIQFVIKRMKVYTDPNAAGYKFPLKNYGVEKYLDLHSQENYDQFCLSYMFTYRDFNDGVLGLAWTASPNENVAGGVCETYKTFSDGQKSLNTGLVTLLNYGKAVPSAVSYTTFAHEIGHNFGSSHDPENNAQCSPGGDNGNYIMYARATSGTQTNNDEFSSCSITEMGPILASKARDADGCFIAYPGSICGNKVVESGEVCDCGWEDECSETCCNPQVTTSTGATPCTLKAGSVCSPSASWCCKSSCNWYTLSDGHVCRANTSCMQESVCQGSYVCPDPGMEPNGTLCAENQVCYLGECSGSICLAYGMESCQCSPTTSGDWKDAKLCQTCCKDTDGVCKSSYDIPGVPNTMALAGNPCNDYKGYCDVFNECREVDPSGPLSRLRNFLLSGAVIDTVKEYLTKHWYIGLAAGVGLVIITVLVIKFCSKSHGPKGKKRAVSRNQISPDARGHI